MTLRLQLHDASAPQVQEIWRELEAVARPAYFLTWSWIENWLACLPDREAPRLAVVRDAGAPVAAWFVGRRLLVRHHFVPSRALFVNATGFPARDELCIEHNGLLQAPGTKLALADLAALLPHWDELFLPGVDGDAFASTEVERARVLVDRDVPAPFVDLSAVRAAGDYLSLVGHKTRAQIRRARRELGDLHVEVAHEPARALAIYDELVALHTAQWRAKGEPGAFADPWIDGFHRRLIAHRVQHGEIQLLAVRTRDRTVGCTYGLIANGRVLVYQSGFASFDDPHVKPGYVCHAAGIELAAAAGYTTYDPLGGGARYKESLATNTQRLVWLRVQRRLPQFALEERLRAWKHARQHAVV